MKKIAILLTVYNRKETTINGLRQLYNSLKTCTHNIKYNIFLTNDGCTDHTEKEVNKYFPDIIIINGSGNLFWSRGMNLAWKFAVDYDKYDYYIWFNDDAILNSISFDLLFEPIKKFGDNIIVSGAFKDSKGEPSYGGRIRQNQIMEPNNSFQEINLMNGNLVLIPKMVFNQLGFIDSHYYHSLGDWDYGLRAKEKDIKVLLTAQYVGVTDRHDCDTLPFYNPHKRIIERFKLLYSHKYSVISTVYFHKRHSGLIKGIKYFIASNLYTLFPLLYHNKE